MDQILQKQPTATPIITSTHSSSCYLRSKIWLLSNIQQTHMLHTQLLSTLSPISIHMNVTNVHVQHVA